MDEEEEESDEEAEEGGMYEMVHQDDDEADDCVLLTGPARKAKQGTEERRMEVKEERGEGGDKDVRECVICMEEFTAENPEMRTCTYNTFLPPKSSATCIQHLILKERRKKRHALPTSPNYPPTSLHPPTVATKQSSSIHPPLQHTYPTQPTHQPSITP